MSWEAGPGGAGLRPGKTGPWGSPWVWPLGRAGVLVEAEFANVMFSPVYICVYVCIHT